MIKHIHKAERKNACDVNAQRNQKHKKEAVVAASNTIVHPWAMVVKRLQKYHGLQSVMYHLASKNNSIFKTDNFSSFPHKLKIHKTKRNHIEKLTALFLFSKINKCGDKYDILWAQRPLQTQ